MIALGKNEFIKMIVCVASFAVAMGFLESAVVIYLREIYYKDGFAFPLRPMSLSLATVEILREAATVIMLVGVGYLAGKNKLQRFAYFSFAFAIWDLFYYAFLYLFLGWPQSLSTWDILFLIPMPWVGPVWAPCLLCILMIGGSLFTISQIEKDRSFSVRPSEWCFLFSGAIICIFNFMLDFLIQSTTSGWLMLFSSESLLSEVQHYRPQSFNHLLFFTGFLLMAHPVALRYLLTKKSMTHEKK
jgi:hypothetical protein